MTAKVWFSLCCGNAIHSVAKNADFHEVLSAVRTHSMYLPS